MFTRLQMFLYMLIILLWFGVQSTYAKNNLSMELQNVNLTDAIHIIAKFLHMNVIVSPSVSGTTTVHLHDAKPIQVLDLLLMANGLAKWEIDNVFFIAPKKELIKRKQEELKWRELVDDSMPLKTQFWQIKYSKAKEIGHLLQDEQSSLMSKRGRVRVDERTNRLCIQDLPENMQIVGRFIKYLDVPVKQIIIEARLASVDNDFERELGVNFITKSQQHNDKDTIAVNSLNQEAGSYSLAVVKLADSSLLDVKLSALEKAGHAELISNPSLFTASQQTASIEAGEEVPYQEISESGGTAVVFKKAVLGLTVTPQVLPGNQILLQLKINQDRPSSRMVQGVPSISTRQISTSVLVKAGQTIVLGGIYESNQEQGEERLPFISQVPLLGLLFKQKNARINRRELLIFVTPKIIS